MSDKKAMAISNMVAFAAAVKDSPEFRYKVQVPKLAPGVVPPYQTRRSQAAAKNDPAGLGPYLALDSEAMAPFWAFTNQFNCGIGFPGYAYLSELAQKAEFRNPVETMAGEMTRKWITLESKGDGDKSTRIKELTEDLETFKIREHFRKIITHDSYFGRAQLYIAIKGQTDDMGRQLPLVIAPETVKKGSLLGFKNIEPIWTTPYTYDSLDPTHPDFFKPRAWYVLGKKTHASRLITVVSREVPDLLKPAFNFGGMSVSQLIEPYVARWLKTVTGVNNLINNFSTMALKTDMTATLAGDPADSIFKRAQLFAQTRDNRGLMLLDFDTEDLVQVAVPLSGLSELQAQAQEHMAGPTHIPLVKLLGITPDGLNASSEGEIRVFYDYVNATQEAVFSDPLKMVLDILQLNRYGDIDPEITAKYEPLDALTGKETAEVRKSDADAGIAYITAGVISPEEERERIANDPSSGYNNLSGPPPEPPEPEIDPETGEPADSGNTPSFGE